MQTQCAQAQKSAIAENSGNFWIHRESALSRWWFNQAERSSYLTTNDGQTIIVLSQGVLNDGPGPDVRDVHLVLDDLEMSGDVEFHVQASDWFRHNHHQDPGYQNVVLHVVSRADTGPDLPTLQVEMTGSTTFSCLASRPPSETELLRASWIRFHEKVSHLEQLGHHGEPHLSALVLGLLETMTAGPDRHQRLHQIAVKLGWTRWPDARPWSGSSQTYPRRPSNDVVIHTILENMEHLQATIETVFQKDFIDAQWASQQPFLVMGVSRAQYREWVINCLAPADAKADGFRLWLETRPFRHYGFEKQAMMRMGLREITSVAHQQALIWWDRTLCRAQQCQFCPLVRCQ